MENPSIMYLVRITTNNTFSFSQRDYEVFTFSSAARCPPRSKYADTAWVLRPSGMKLAADFPFGLQNGFCDFDAFGTNLGALEVGLTTPDSMGRLHDLHPIQDIRHPGIKQVALRPQHCSRPDELWLFVKDDGARRGAAGAHDAFYGFRKQRTFVDGLLPFLTRFNVRDIFVPSRMNRLHSLEEGRQVYNQVFDNGEKWQGLNHNVLDVIVVLDQFLTGQGGDSVDRHPVGTAHSMTTRHSVR